MEVGDFDQTPAPSARPSMNQLAGQGQDDTPREYRPTSELPATYRHHLLKTSPSGPLIVDKDVPVQPTITRNFKDDALRASPAQSSNNSENRASVPSSRPSTRPLPQSPPPNAPLGNRGVSPNLALAERVCADPSLHPYGRNAHAYARHPGLLKGADFCDHGGAVHGSFQLWSSSSRSTPSSDELSIRSGQQHQLMPDGKVVKVDVEIHTPRHHGHSRTVKVRPQPEVSSGQPTGRLSQDISWTPQKATSKARPFDAALEVAKVQEDSGSRNDDARPICTRRVSLPLSLVTPSRSPPSQIPSPSAPDGTAQMRHGSHSSFEDSRASPLQTTRPCSVDSYSTVGSHPGHRHSAGQRAKRVRPGHALNDCAPAMGVKRLSCHSIQGCRGMQRVSIGPLDKATENPVLTLDASDRQHSLLSCERFQHAAGPVSHPLDACIRCSSGLPPRRRTASSCIDCPAYVDKAHLAHDPESLQANQAHKMSQCMDFPISPRMDFHAFEDCDRHSLDLPAITHSVAECETQSIIGPFESHSQNSCLFDSPESKIVVSEGHDVDSCERQPLYRGPPLHLVQDDEEFPLEVLPGKHRPSQCDQTLFSIGKLRLHEVESDARQPVAKYAGRDAVEECQLHSTSSRSSLPHPVSDATMPTTRYPLWEMSTPYRDDAALQDDDLRIAPIYSIQLEGLTYSAGEHGPHQKAVPEIFRLATNRESREPSEGMVPTLFDDESNLGIVRRESVLIADSEDISSAARDITFIQSPVPVSKVRPHLILGEDMGVEQHLGHTAVSKAKAMENLSDGDSMQTERRFHVRAGGLGEAEHESFTTAKHSASPSRSTTTSLLNGGQTTRWLRNLLKYPESYATRLTELPSSRRTSKQHAGTQRRPSEPVLPSSISKRPPPAASRPLSKSDTRVDGTVFQRAVNDLEKLLNEALSLASQVTEHPGDFAQESPEQLSHDRRKVQERASEHSSSDESDTSEGYVTPGSGRDSVDEIYIVPEGQVSGLQRPQYKHAETFCGTPRRPRLSEVVQTYSGYYDDIEIGGDLSCPPRRESATVPPLRQVAFQIPNRRSSMYHVKHPMPSTFPKAPEDKRPLSEENQQKQEVRADMSALTTAVLELGHELKPRSADRQALRGAIGQHASVNSHTGGEDNLPQFDMAGRQVQHEIGISLRNRSHVSLRSLQGFSLARLHKRHPVARDWSPVRKRFAATVACLSTALVGIIIGVFAGLVPSIQYYILDNSHATVHGNTGCLLGLAIPTFFFWPLPLLHGRKPYILSSLVLAMCLLFPQAVAVEEQRLTHTGDWRCLLLVTRTLMGFCLGFASMNFHSTLTDLFGASLMSSSPHQEVVDRFDARRHGGGMGVWLGIWTWCWIGSLGIGFLIGAAIIDSSPPVWGFYTSIILIAIVLILNVISPEVRRSAYRRSVAVVRTGTDVSRRLARGEIMMHRVKTGPRWWGQEVYHGILLSLEMLRQPGFATIALYCGWIYAQVVLIIILLGSLASNYYRLRSPSVGLIVACVALGAVLAIPFQKASLFSRFRQDQLDNNRLLLERKVSWSSHLLRRAIFTIMLPLVGISYAAVSSGPPIHLSGPTIFATLVGFLSCLAISECNGLVMETFDSSDLNPGMTGRQRGPTATEQLKKKNYSAFPRVSAAFAVIHSFAFVLAAGATALGGQVTRALGQQLATGIVACILFLFTVLLLLVLVRFKEVQIIPLSKTEEMDRLIETRRQSTIRRVSMPTNVQALVEEENAWRPAMIGNPVGKSRRMNVLELGSLTRWQEIRRRNKLVDEGAHLNRAALDHGLGALDHQMTDLRQNAHELLRKASGRGRNAKRSHRSDPSDDLAGNGTEMDVLSRQPIGGATSTPFFERECFMGQTVVEENEDDSSGLRRRL